MALISCSLPWVVLLPMFMIVIHYHRRVRAVAVVFDVGKRIRHPTAQQSPPLNR